MKFHTEGSLTEESLQVAEFALTPSSFCTNKSVLLSNFLIFLGFLSKLSRPAGDADLREPL